MSLNFDERFPSLESVEDFLNSEESTPEWRQKSIQAKMARNHDERSQQEQIQVDEQLAIVRRILESGTSGDEIGITMQNKLEIEAIRKLEDEKALVERAIETSNQLSNNPSQHAESLRDTLEDLSGMDESNEIVSGLVAAIKSQWYDTEMASRLDDLKNVLAKAGWPKSDPPVESSELLNTFKKAIYLELSGSLSTFNVLVEPLAERIKFNFQSSRDTARSDKPEWLFAYVFRLLDPRFLWLSKELRKLVDSPMDKIILALIPTLLNTCHKTYSIDTHFVQELIQFGNDISNRYFCSFETINQLLYGILVPETLREYLALEKASYNHSLNALLKAGSESIDFDADVPCAKPTFMALNVRQMVQQADYLLRLDPQAVLQMIHLDIVRSYVEFLENKMNLYERSHSSLARAVSTNKDVLPQDVSDIEYLGRIYGSASFFKGFLEMWGNNLLIASTTNNVSEYIQSLDELRSKAASRIASSLTREAQKKLKSYFRIDWNHLNSENDDTASSSIIRTSIDALQPTLIFINRLCPHNRSDRARVSVPFSDSLAKIFWRLVIQANVFSSSSAQQLQLDVESLWLALDLPDVHSYSQIIEATNVLQTGSKTDVTTLTDDEIDGLMSRRVDN